MELSLGTCFFPGNDDLFHLHHVASEHDRRQHQRLRADRHGDPCGLMTTEETNSVCEPDEIEVRVNAPCVSAVTSNESTTKRDPVMPLLLSASIIRPATIDPPGVLPRAPTTQVWAMSQTSAPSPVSLPRRLHDFGSFECITTLKLFGGSLAQLADLCGALPKQP